MAWHLYIMPIVVKTKPTGDSRYPKYLDTNFAMMDYGFQQIGLVAADVDNAADAAITANADVRRLPDNLDQQLGAALTVVQTALENNHLPAGWLVSTMTYRQVLRVILGFFAFMQRFPVVTGIIAPLLDGANISLNTQFNQLSVANRNRLIAVANSFALNTSGLSGTTTLRVILKNIADQMNWTTATLGGITI